MEVDEMSEGNKFTNNSGFFSKEESNNALFGDIAAVRVTQEGKEFPPEIARTIEELDISDALKRNTTKEIRDYQGLERVQQIAIPTFLKHGHDMVVISPTGSGKTLAFVIPILHELTCNVPNEFPKNGVSQDPATGIHIHYPRAIIIVPTRELAIQINDVISNLSKGLGAKIRVALAIGGMQTEFGNSKCDGTRTILIGTCGRIVDEICMWKNSQGEIQIYHPDKAANSGYHKFSLKFVQFIVLDEADRLVRKNFNSFYQDMLEIYEHSDLNGLTHSLMFSATFPTNTQLIAKRFLFQDFIKIEIAPPGTANKSITQEFIRSKPVKKGAKNDVNAQYNYAKLVEIIDLELGKEDADFRILVFINGPEYEYTVMQDHLLSYGIDSASLHQNMKQTHRIETLKKFIGGKCRVLLSNALAERGLDIPELDLIINFHLPSTVDSYVQRIGRTGRAGRPGRAITFFPENYPNIYYAKELAKVLEDAEQEVPSVIEEIIGKREAINQNVFKDVPTDLQIANPANLNASGKKKKLNVRQRNKKKKENARKNALTDKLKELSISK